ncbi:MAG: hypothetical protein M1813_009063 [Trichoglossum hirsutum]|nr:MAG: hypothetical protein M1813_009063 [Trichoglossum hirsutum]
MAQEPEPIRLGGVAPDFEADTTQGYIKFYDYIGDSWALLFCYPEDFSPIATTELVLFAHLQQEFAKRNAKLLVITTENEPTADGQYVPHEEWVKDVNDIGPIPMEFPIVKDTSGSISLRYEVLDEQDAENLTADNEVTTGKAFKSRTIFIIGPLWEGDHHIRMIVNYPAAVGFSTGEVLRTLDALQLSDSTRVRTPANWVPGGDVIVHPEMEDGEAVENFPNFVAVKPYLRFVELPVKKLSAQNMFFRGGGLTSFGVQVKDGVMTLQKGSEEHDIEAMA